MDLTEDIQINEIFSNIFNGKKVHLPSMVQYINSNTEWENLILQEYPEITKQYNTILKSVVERKEVIKRLMDNIQQ